MGVPPFTTYYQEALDERPKRFTSWQEAESYLHVEGWPWDRTFWPEWSWAHLTDAMIDEQLSLPFRLVYAVLLERSGLPMPTRAVLQHLARRVGGKDDASGRRAWPKLYQIADRTGASRRTVQAAIHKAEQTGWLLVVRHRQAPSDYLLDVPDYQYCPCVDCLTKDARGAGDAPRDAGAASHRAGDAPPGCSSDTLGVQEPRTHLVHALGSSLDSELDSEHLRRPSDEGSAIVEEIKLKAEAFRHGQTIRDEMARGRGDRDQAIANFRTVERLAPYEQAFLDGMYGKQEVAS